MRRLRVGFGVFLVLFLALMLRAGGGRTLTGTAHQITDPVTAVTARTGEGLFGVVQSVFRMAALSARVRAVEDERTRLEAQLARQESIEAENTNLRKELGLLPRAQFRLVVADVSGPTTDGASTTLRINRGTADGLADGLPVIAADGIVVGQLTKLERHSALVDLITGGRVRVAVRAVGSGADGIVRGLRGLDLVLEDVPRTQTLTLQDRLVTTGIDGVFPPHLLVGSVKAIRAPENAIFQEASVQLPIDLHRLRIAAVIVGS